ncbi:MAG: hypothetical protein QM715_19530 [Nibricoccus sp.]
MNTSFACKTSLILTSLFNPGKIERDKHLLRQLAVELEVVQNRLGTSNERADDCELARGLGHEIRNKLLIVSLWESLGFTEMPPEIRRQIAPIARAEVN